MTASRNGLYQARITLVIEGASQPDANARARDIAELLYKIQHVVNNGKPGPRLMDLHAELNDRLCVIDRESLDA